MAVMGADDIQFSVFSRGFKYLIHNRFCFPVQSRFPCVFRDISLQAVEIFKLSLQGESNRIVFLSYFLPTKSVEPFNPSLSASIFDMNIPLSVGISFTS